MRLQTLSIPCFLSLASWIQSANALNISACTAASLAAYSASPNSTTFYNQNGMPTEDLTQAWGISYGSCKALCTEPEPFDWTFFSECMTSWLIPWLALAAQLPFETIDRRSNLIVMLLAIGSPALITYSLALTILNARWINESFRQIKDKLNAEKFPQQTNALRAARRILIESHHIPIQIVNGPHHEISQLIGIPENWTWWVRLLELIQKTKRGWTYSLYSNVGWVFVAQLLTIIDFFNTKNQSKSIGVGLAINCLWMWMIPITLGWVYVGTQTYAGSIKEALSNVVIPVLHGETNVAGRCIGIQDRSVYGAAAILARGRHDSDPDTKKYPRMEAGGLTMERKGSMDIEISNPSSSSGSEQSGTLGSDNNESQSVIGDLSTDFGTFFGLSIAGCELEAGPIFNYARVWSHTSAVNHVVEGFHRTIVRLGDEAVRKGKFNEKNQAQSLDGSPKLEYTSSNYEDVLSERLPIHGRAHWSVVLNMFSAGLIALLMQWATTGSAVIIAYKSVPR